MSDNPIQAAREAVAKMVESWRAQAAFHREQAASLVDPCGLADTAEYTARTALAATLTACADELESALSPPTPRRLP